MTRYRLATLADGIDQAALDRNSDPGYYQCTYPTDPEGSFCGVRGSTLVVDEDDPNTEHRRRRGLGVWNGAAFCPDHIGAVQS